MTDPTTPSNGSSAPNVTQRVLALYTRDLSFENMLAKRGGAADPQNELSIQVSLKSGKRAEENQYEVITKLDISNKSKSTGDPLFRLELEYSGVFFIDGLADEHLQSYLHIECPRITFPFLRRIVSDVTLDGGFPPLVLDTIDFVSLYRKEIVRRAQSN